MSNYRRLFWHIFAWTLVLVPGLLLDIIASPFKSWKMVGFELDKKECDAIRRERVLRDVRLLIDTVESDLHKRRSEKRTEVN